ncbi:MAG TPA: MFS transporter [Gallionellaceae bacterium]
MSHILTLPPAQERRLLLSLSGIQFTHILDVMVIMPLAPMLMRTFSLSAAQFGWLVSAYTMTAATSAIITALIVDRYDLRRVVLGIYAAFIVATALCAIAPSYGLLLIARGLSGAFGGVLGSMVHVYIADTIPYERRGKATGKLMAAFSLSTVLGVPLSLLLVNQIPVLGWRAPFLLVALVGLLVWWLARGSLPSIPARTTDMRLSRSFAPMRQVLRHPNHWRAYLFMMLMMLGGFTVIPYITLYSTLNLAYPERLLWVLYLVGGLFIFFTSRWFGHLSDRYGKPRVFRIIAVLAMLPILAMTHATALPWWGVICITTPFFILVSGRFVPGMAIMTAAGQPHLRGTFMSMMSAVQSAGSSIATLIAGHIITLNSQGQLEHYNIVGYVACTSILLTLLLVSHIRIGTSEPHKA